jgi:Bacteriophage baseplate protein W
MTNPNPMTGPYLPPEPIGWPLLPLPDEQGRLMFPTLEQSVREAIRVILSTRPGEQLMRPGFGGGLAEFLQEPNTLSTRRAIHDAVIQSLTRWELRIDVDRVDVLEIPDRADELRVEIAYRLRRTGAARQLGVVLRLED